MTCASVQQPNWMVHTKREGWYCRQRVCNIAFGVTSFCSSSPLIAYEWKDTNNFIYSRRERCVVTFNDDCEIVRKITQNLTEPEMVKRKKRFISSFLDLSVCVINQAILLPFTGSAGKVIGGHGGTTTISCRKGKIVFLHSNRCLMWSCLLAWLHLFFFLSRKWSTIFMHSEEVIAVALNCWLWSRRHLLGVTSKPLVKGRNHDDIILASVSGERIRSGVACCWSIKPKNKWTEWIVHSIETWSGHWRDNANSRSRQLSLRLRSQLLAQGTYIRYNIKSTNVSSSLTLIIRFFRLSFSSESFTLTPRNDPGILCRHTRDSWSRGLKEGERRRSPFHTHGSVMASHVDDITIKLRGE